MGARLIFHSRLSEDMVPVQEHLVLDDGLVLVFDLGNWWEYDDRRVHRGEHFTASTATGLAEVMDELRNYSNTDRLTMAVLHDALRN